MKENNKRIYINELLLVICTLILIIFIERTSQDIKNFSLIVVLTLIIVFLTNTFGIKKDNTYLKGNATRTIISSLMSYMLIIYGLGIILGFTRGYSLLNLSVVKKFIFVLIINIEIEYIRFLIAKNSFKNTKDIVLFTIISIIINVVLEVNLNSLKTTEDKFIFLSTIIFPTIAEETLCSYVTYKMGLLPSLIYKLVMKLYIYIIPIVPDLGDYIYSAVNVMFPFIIYNVLNKTIIRYEKEKQKLKKINTIIFTIPIIIILIILVLLVSGIFKYKLIAIASNSMKPTYARGDAVIYEKVNYDQFEIGDILAIKTDKRIVTHRIVRIINKNNEYSFITKGDNNNANDTFVSKNENVLGKVKIAFKYIGYPTVIINEIFGKE